MNSRIGLWSDKNIKETVNDVLVVIDGLPLDFAEYILGEVRKAMRSRAVIQTPECPPQQTPQAEPDKTGDK